MSYWLLALFDERVALFISCPLALIDRLCELAVINYLAAL